MKTVINSIRDSVRLAGIRRMTALLLMVAFMVGMLTTPAYAASTEKASVEVGGTKYLRDNSSPSLAGASIVKNSWIWQSSNPHVADIITNNAPSCQIKGMAVGTAIISCTVYVTTSRTNPITNRTELNYGKVMGSTYEVTVTESGTNTNTGTGTGIGGGKSTYMKAVPENLIFDLATYGEPRVELTVSSGAPTNNIEYENSQYVWVRKSQSLSSIYKYTLTIGLMPNTSVGDYTAEVLLKTFSGAVRDRISIPITVICSHSYDSWTVAQEASCTQAGKRTRNCQYCGNTQTETIPITGHTFETGWHSNDSQHWRECVSCNEKSDTASHVWDNGTIISQADYNRDGVKNYTCTVCGVVKTESIPQQICQTHNFDFGMVTVAATCAAEGIRARTCRNCGIEKTESISKLNTHRYNGGQVTVPATATYEGMKTYTCTVCGTTKTESIPISSSTSGDQTSEKRVPYAYFSAASLSGVSGKTGRNLLHTNSTGSISYTSSDPSVASVNSIGRVSFLKAGMAVITASVAETRRYQTVSASYVIIVTDSNTIGNSGTTNQTSVSTTTQSSCRGIHTYNQGVIQRNPTCSTSGESVYTCVLCGYVRTRWISPTFQHVYDNGVVTQQPVGRRSGRITFTCINCGYTKTRIFFR